MPSQSELAIAAFYGDRVAFRSKVPLIRHIEEGCEILNRIGASQLTKDAFCLHPMLQDDLILHKNFYRSDPLRDLTEWKPVALAMEYRAVANRYLSAAYTGFDDVIQLGPLREVHQMLIADKVQNRKDFEIHHLNKHPKSELLQAYFNNWLRALGVTEKFYQELIVNL